VLPRLESPRLGSDRGTAGIEARAWLESAYGMKLRAWQAYALDRALEVDEEGRLVWSTVVVTVARQSGKSWLSRAMCMWRLHHADRFGEEQTVLHVANRRSTAMEVMRPAAVWAVEKYGKKAVRWGNEQTGIHLPSGDRWLIHAANESAGVGYSCSLTFVDEAWKIPRTVVEDALAPTMAEREQPQLWLVSTAGDSTSDLMHAYRQAALDQAPGVLLLEWSAPPEANPDEEATWRWASPEWSPKRQEFLTRQHANIDPQAWRKEYLNQWVTRSGHWLKEAWWSDSLDAAVQLPTSSTWAVAIESEFDGMGHAVAIAAADDDGTIVTRVTTHRTLADVDTRIREIRGQHHAVHIAATPGYVDRLREPFDALVGNREAAAATQTLLDLFDRRQIRHDGSTVLAEHLAASTISKRQGGWTISAPQGRGGVYAARAVMFAVAQAAKAPKPRPVIVSRTRRTA
jgi:hypothetical protein